MIKLYLYLIDITVPLFFGILTILLDTNADISKHVLLLYLLLSFSIFFLSIIKNYYKDYYLINFSEKLRIASVTWVFAIFIQLLAYNYLLVQVDLLTLIFWILIPIVNLILKYIVKIKTKYTMKFQFILLGDSTHSMIMKSKCLLIRDIYFTFMTLMMNSQTKK